MKRTAAATFAAIALAASLTACGSGSDSATTAESTAAETTAAATTEQTQEATDTDQAEGTPVDVATVANVTAPEGFTDAGAQSGEGAIGFVSADGMRTIVISAQTSSEDVEAAVAALSATGGMVGQTQVQSGATTAFTETGSVTVDGETGASYSSTSSDESTGMSAATRGAYVSHNGTLVFIGYTALNLSGAAEVSEADFQTVLSSITWK